MIEQAGLRNRILSRLSPGDFALLADHLHPVRMERGHVIWRKGEPLDNVYFLERGVASIVATSRNGERAEAGLIGREGYVHPAVVLGADRSVHDAQIQLADDAFRIASAHLLAAFEESATLRRVLLRYAQVYATQVTHTTLSASVHQVEHRLARWLLMCHDRSDSDDLALTHEFLGLMLAAQRPTVTQALHKLEGNGLIRGERGCITVRNRAALETFATDAYGQPEDEYRRLIGPV